MCFWPMPGTSAQQQALSKQLQIQIIVSLTMTIATQAPIKSSIFQGKREGSSHLESH